MSDVLPSQLRHRVTLEELARAEDEGGGFDETWVEVATLFADVRPIGGAERVEADRLEGQITHEITLRFRQGVVPAMRFRKGGRLFHVVSVVNVEERGRWLKCRCEERDL